MSRANPREDRLDILAVHPTLPRPEAGAGDVRFVALLAMLAKRHRVDLVALYPPTDDDARMHAHADRMARLGVAALSADEARLDQVLLRTRYDVVWFEFSQTTPPEAVARVRALQPWARVVVDAVDVGFARRRLAAGLGLLDPEEVERDAAAELRTCRASDAVVVLTDEDEQTLRAEGEVPPLFHVPLVASNRARPERARERRLLFVGGFSHPPNADGLRWFVAGSWPRIRAEVPDASLVIVGADTPKAVEELAAVEGVQVRGFVPDLDPEHDAAAVSIAPLRYGAGMKGKVVEAMAAGVPVATTPIGAQGLRATAGRHLVVAEDPEELARGVIELLRDPERAERMGRAGQAHIATLCAPSVVEEQLLAVLSALAMTTDPRELAAERSAIANRCLEELDAAVRLRGEKARREAELAWMKRTRLWRARSLTLRMLGRRADRRRFRT